MSVLSHARVARLLAAAAVVAAVAGSTSAWAAGTNHGPTSVGSGLVGSKHLKAGELLTATPLTTAAALPSAASTQLITYVSNDAQGRPIVVSGTVALPGPHRHAAAGR